jgi:acyl homoserine lactone synthase
MLRYLYADELSAFPKLARTMFTDRATQFRDRMKWEVSVDDNGEERDVYDHLNPLYVIWQHRDGSHGGSMRFLPTTGSTMVEDCFLHLTDGVRIVSPFIWECTRFCLARDAGRTVSAALMLGGLDLGLSQGLSHAIGVFDARMVRIYRALGWPPAILGTDGQGAEKTSVGLWAFEPELRSGLLAKAGLSAEVADFWLARAFAATGAKIA